MELLRLRLGLEPFPDGAELVLGRFVAEGVRRDEAADLGDAPDLDDRPEPPVLAEPPDGADPDLDDPPDLDERPDFADPPDRLLDDFGRSADLWLFCAI